MVVTSPVIKQSKENTVSFYEGLQMVELGKKITKLEWDNPLIYGVMHQEQLCLHKDDGKTYQWIVSDGDMAGKDWVVID